MSGTPSEPDVLAVPGPASDAATAAPAADGAANEAAPGEAFAAFVDRVREAQPALASVLEHGRVVAFGPEGVKLAYPKPSFFWETLTEPTGRREVEGHLAAHLGAEVRLQLTPLGAAHAADTSLAERHRQALRARAESLEEAAQRHPLVHQAADVLGAQVLAVRAVEG